MDARIPNQPSSFEPQGKASLFKTEAISGSHSNSPFTSLPSFLNKPYPKSEVGFVNEGINGDKSWQQLLVLFIMAVSVTAGVYFVRYRLREPLPILTKLEQNNQIGKTKFTGKIQPAKTFAIASYYSSIVEDIKVEIGDQIKVGQPLLVLKNIEAERELKQAQKEQQTLLRERKVARQQQQALKQQQKIAQQQQLAALKQKDMDLQEQQMGQQQEILKLEQKIQYFDQNSAPLGANVAEAEAELKIAQNQMQQVPLPQRQDSVERAEALYQKAESSYQRYLELQEQGAVSEEKLEEIAAEMKVAQADLDSAKAAIVASETFTQAQTKQSQLQSQLVVDQQQQELTDMKAKLKLAQLQYQQLTEQRQMVEQQLTELRAIELPYESIETNSLDPEEPLTEIKTIEVITATRSGVIVDLPVAVGNQIFAGTKVVDLAEMENLNVEVPVSSRLINALHLGQKAIVEIGGGDKTQEFEATVVRINPLPSENLNHQVILQFKNVKNDLLAGQLATVYFYQEQNLGGI
ncbi:MAG: HlyD family secretion protein [Planktothrix sp.]